MQDQLNEINNRIHQLGKDKLTALSEIGRLESSQSGEQDLTLDLEREYKLKKQTLEMLPDATNNIKRLQVDVQGQVKKLVALAGQCVAIYYQFVCVVL